MGLLSDSDIAAFKSAIKQVTDTFMKLPVVITVNTRKVSAFNQGRSSTSSPVTYNLLALGIYESNGERAKSDMLEAGTFNMSEGYLLFNFEDFQGAGLIGASPNYTPLVTATNDTLTFYGKIFEISGVNLTGPIEDKYALVKVHFNARSHGQ